MREIVLSDREKYLGSLLGEENETKKMSRQFADELGLGRISVSAPEARLVQTLVRMHGCKKFVEIGTLTGLSAQYICEGLVEGGELWTLEKEAKHADMAKQVFAKMNMGSKKIHMVVGDARVELERIASEGPFDGVFIDGNKAAYLDYLMWAEKNLRSGGLVLADNVFLSGAVWGDTSLQRFSEKQARVMQEFNQRLADTSLYTSSLIPTFEGLFVAIKK
ncbi:O-methyltransferase [Bdellovibrio sp. HCB2-146]|uniref:O-methyltransferase n=1 Tax=Bdellovibrio sp. HCB2-146 TaxID=3394362 RepID=UPI0039BC4E62